MRNQYWLKGQQVTLRKFRAWFYAKYPKGNFRLFKKKHSYHGELIGI